MNLKEYDYLKLVNLEERIRGILLSSWQLLWNTQGKTHGYHESWKSTYIQN